MENNFSPRLMLICVMHATAWKQFWCFASEWRNVCFSAPNCLKRLLQDSWHARAPDLSLFSLVDLQSAGVLSLLHCPLCPSSASAISPGGDLKIKSFRKLLTSGQGPQGKGPFVCAMSPPMMEIATSWRSPGPLNLWEHHRVLKGVGSFVLKSVPSTVMQLQFSKAPPLNLLSHLICGHSSIVTSFKRIKIRIVKKPAPIFWYWHLIVNNLPSHRTGKLFPQQKSMPTCGAFFDQPSNDRQCCPPNHKVSKTSTPIKGASAVPSAVFSCASKLQHILLLMFRSAHGKTSHSYSHKCCLQWLWKLPPSGEPFWFFYLLCVVRREI